MPQLAWIGSAEAAEPLVRMAPRCPTALFTATVANDMQTARQAAQTLSAQHAYTSVEALLQAQEDKLDAVLIHSTSGWSAEDFGQLAESGVISLVPFGIAATLEMDDAQIMVGESYRFSPAASELQQSICAGELGDAGLLRLHDWRANIAESVASNKESLPFQRLPGRLAGIDLICWMMGRSPDIVYLPSGQLTGESIEMISQQLHLGFGSGMAILDWVDGLPGDVDYFSLSAIGARGAAYADDHHNMQIRFGGGEPAALLTSTRDAARAAELASFLEFVEHQRAPAVSQADARRAVAVAVAALAAADRSTSARSVGEPSDGVPSYQNTETDA